MLTDVRAQRVLDQSLEDPNYGRVDMDHDYQPVSKDDFDRRIRDALF